MMPSAFARASDSMPFFWSWSATTSQNVVWSPSSGCVADGCRSTRKSTISAASYGSRQMTEIAGLRSSAKSSE